MNMSPPLLHDDVDVDVGTDANVHASQSARVKVGTGGQGWGAYRKEFEGEGKSEKIGGHKSNNAAGTDRHRQFRSPSQTKSDAIKVLQCLPLHDLSELSIERALKYSDMKRLLSYKNIRNDKLTKIIMRTIIYEHIMKGTYTRDIQSFRPSWNPHNAVKEKHAIGSNTLEQASVLALPPNDRRNLEISHSNRMTSSIMTKSIGANTSSLTTYRSQNQPFLDGEPQGIHMLKTATQVSDDVSCGTQRALYSFNLSDAEAWLPVEGDLTDVLKRQPAYSHSQRKQPSQRINPKNGRRSNIILNFSIADWEPCAQVTIDKLEIGNPDYLLHKLVSAGAGAFSGVPLARPGARASAGWESASGPGGGGDEIRNEIRNENEIANGNGSAVKPRIAHIREQIVPGWQECQLVSESTPQVEKVCTSEIVKSAPNMLIGAHRRSIEECLLIYPTIKFVRFENNNLDGLNLILSENQLVLDIYTVGTNTSDLSKEAQLTLDVGDQLVYVSGVCPLTHLKFRIQRRILQMQTGPVILGFVKDAETVTPWVG
jgi:hypothetical protein